MYNPNPIMMEWIDTTTENHMTRDHMEITIATMSHNIYHLINPIITSQNIHRIVKITAYYKSKYSDFINKIKCKNNNININGENNGDINLGNNGQGAAAAEERYLSAISFGSGNVGEG